MTRRPNLRRAAAIVAAGMAVTSPALAGEGISYAAIPPGAYSVVAQVRAKPGKAAELRAVTLPLIAQVRGDPKNLVYFLQEDREAPGHFVFYEIFATKADFEAHNAMPYVKAWFEKLPALARRRGHGHAHGSAGRALRRGQPSARKRCIRGTVKSRKARTRAGTS